MIPVKETSGSDLGPCGFYQREFELLRAYYSLYR